MYLNSFISLSEILVIYGCEDHFRINRCFIRLCTDRDRIVHDVIDQAGIAMGVACNGTHGCLVDGKEQRLSFFVVQIPYLLLNRLKHTRLVALGGYAQDETELLLEFGDTDSRQAYVFHVVKVRVEILCKATEGIRLPHAGAGGEQAAAAGILEVIKAGSHLPEVF